MEEINNIILFTKQSFKWTKDNLSVVLILPAILGGIWQIIELSSISFSFIRFFSVSQVVPDGLLILLFLTLFTISSIFLYLLYHYTINKYNKIGNNINSLSVNELEPKRNNLVIATILMVFYLATLTFYIYIIDLLLDKLNSMCVLTILFPTGMILMYFAMGFYIYANLYSMRKKLISNIYRSLVWLMPGAVFISCLLFASQFHKIFLLPEQLINVEILKQRIEKQNPAISSEIIYANDKYIFIELNGFMQLNGKPVRKLIRVINFDDMLEYDENSYTPQRNNYRGS